MNRFEDIHLEWSGKKYVIKRDDVMRTIAVIEDYVTMKDLGEYAKRGTAPIAKISMAYAAVLRIAGCNVTSEEVYESVFKKGGQEMVIDAVTGLMHLMLPPSAIASGGGQDTASKKPAKGQKGSSKKHTSMPL